MTIFSACRELTKQETILEVIVSIRPHPVNSHLTTYTLKPCPGSDQVTAFPLLFGPRQHRFATAQEPRRFAS